MRGTPGYSNTSPVPTQLQIRSTNHGSLAHIPDNLNQHSSILSKSRSTFLHSNPFPMTVNGTSCRRGSLSTETVLPQTKPASNNPNLLDIHDVSPIIHLTGMKEVTTCRAEENERGKRLRSINSRKDENEIVTRKSCVSIN